MPTLRRDSSCTQAYERVSLYAQFTKAHYCRLEIFETSKIGPILSHIIQIMQIHTHLVLNTIFAIVLKKAATL